MRYEYGQPAADLAPYVGAYYVMEMPDSHADRIRAELPFLRIILAGTSELENEGERIAFEAPSMVLCGPSFRTGHAAVSAGTLIVGAMIKPLGWQALAGVAMADYANRKVQLSDVRPVDVGATRDRLMRVRDDTAKLFATLDNLLRELLRPDPEVNEKFLQLASTWLGNAQTLSVDDLVQRSGLSHRQVDRLCRVYFGAAPKRLQRKYRVLQVMTRLAWTGETDWRQVAGDGFYDQSHFIKDFKAMVGYTPGEFTTGPHQMIRFDLERRLKIPHDSFFSVIA